MARYVGIDIGTTQVKVAVVRGTARKWIVEELLEVDRVPAESVAQGVFGHDGQPMPVMTLDDVLTEVGRDAAAGGDPLSVGFDGTRTYVRSIEVPAAVRRRLQEVLPFELEAQLPFDIDEAVWDHRARGGVPQNAPLPVLVAAARITDVRDRIDQIKRTVGREPDHVAPGAFPLADLAAALPQFRTAGPRAILDLGFESAELLVLEGGEPVFARTLSRGVTGMPATAGYLAREIRQSFAAYRASGFEPPTSVYVTGGGALVPDLARWLSGELQLTVEVLPLGGIEGFTLDKRPDAHRFTRAVGIALAASPKRRGLDLRKGPLAFERGFGFLREKVPLLAGLGATILVAFLFATWTRARNLSADRKTLETALQATTKDVFSDATSDLDRVAELLANKAASADDDPLPRADAMDVMMQLSELIPTSKMKHDIDKLEVQRQPGGGFKVILQGIAPNGTDVSTIESNLKAYRCFTNPTVVKKTKAISDDRIKYTLETELRCPEEGGGPKKPAGGAPGAAGSK